MAVGRTCRTTTVALGGGDEAKAYVYPDDPDHDGRVVAERGDERWTFTVDDGVAELAKTSEADDLLDLPEPPAWVETVLWEVNIAEVDGGDA